MNIAEIIVYPVKSLRGSDVNQALVCRYGLEHDRQWILVDTESKMITQRECPRIATLVPHVEEAHLRIDLPSGEEVVASLAAEAWGSQPVKVDVFGNVYVGVSAAQHLNAALGDAIGMTCRLVSIRSDLFRTRNEVAFHDDSPMLLISRTSLDELNKRLPASLPMDRFRPNLVIEDAKPYEEDLWQRIAIGDTVLRAVKQCERCVTTTVDQAAGVFAGPEPLKTLATFRRKGQNVAFGQYYRPENTGAKLHLGDEVRVLELKPEAASYLPS